MLRHRFLVPEVSSYLGHADPAITMRVYAHPLDGTSGMAADGMDEALGQLSEALGAVLTGTAGASDGLLGCRYSLAQSSHDSLGIHRPRS